MAKSRNPGADKYCTSTRVVGDTPFCTNLDVTVSSDNLTVCVTVRAGIHNLSKKEVRA